MMSKTSIAIGAVAIVLMSAIATYAPSVTTPLLDAWSSGAPPAPPYQRLTPDDGSHDDYRAAERRLFREVFVPNVLARVIVEPSFSNEYAVAILRRGNGYALLVLEPSERIWLSSNVDGIRLKRCDLSLPDMVARDALDSWSRLLRAPRSPAAYGADGISHRFSMTISGVPVTGQAWSPDPGTPPGMLVDIAERLAKACWTRSNASLNAIPALADKLRAAVP